MKKRVTIILLCATALWSSAQDCSTTTNLDTTLCEGQMLPIVSDFIGNTNSLSFDGQDDWAEIDFNEDLVFLESDFSISLWFKIDNTTGRQNLISMPSSTWASFGSYCVYVENGFLRFTVRNNCCEPWYVHLITEEVSTDEWHHVVATADRVNGQTELFLNGESVGTQAWDGLTFHDATEPLLLGVQYKEDYPGQYFAFFDGQMDELSLFDRVLGAEEIGAYFDCPIGNAFPTTHARWNFDDATDEGFSSIDEARAGELIGGAEFSDNSPFADGPFTYAWSDGSTTSEIDYEVSTQDVLSVVMQGLDDYSFEESFSLNVLENDILSETVPLCFGGNYTFPDGETVENITADMSHVSAYVNELGCDSVITTHIDLGQLVSDTVYYGGDQLAAGSSALTYQWYACNGDPVAISSATDSIFTFLASGNFMVEMSTGACTMQSECLFYEYDRPSAIHELEFDATLYPNPSDGLFNISSSERISYWEIWDMSGRLQRKDAVTGQHQFRLTTDLQTGQYILKLFSERKTMRPMAIFVN